MFGCTGFSKIGCLQRQILSWSKGSKTMPLKITQPSKAPGDRSLSYKICPLFIFSFFLLRSIHIFRGNIYSLGGFFVDLFLEREISRGNFTLREFDMLNYFYLFYFLFVSFILHVEMFKGNCPWEIFGVIWYPQKKFHGRGDFWSDQNND